MTERIATNNEIPCIHERRGTIHYRLDGSLWAKGQTLENKTQDYWKWCRVDGTILRSSHFDQGRQVGKWTTYNKQGKACKVTTKGG